MDVVTEEGRRGAVRADIHCRRAVNLSRTRRRKGQPADSKDRPHRDPEGTKRTRERRGLGRVIATALSFS